MSSMKDVFSSYHPAINFSFFTIVIFCGMFFLHPLLLVISLSAAFLYYYYLNGKKALKLFFIIVLPMMVGVSLINPLFNHRGVTVLGYFRHNPITQESIFYGAITGLMFGTIILWFACYNKVMTSDKFVYLFGRIIPSMSLIFSMVLRFVPKFTNQFRIVSDAQRTLGRDVGDKGKFQKIKQGIKETSIMVTWSLENSLDTADSMKARGYGLPGRTAFSIFRLDSRDKLLLVGLGGIVIVLIGGVILDQHRVQYFPRIIIPETTSFSYILYGVYTILCLLPIILNVVEDLKWKHLQSRI